MKPVPLYESMLAKHQHPEEHAFFCENVVRRLGVTSYLEIGSKFGCSLWAVSRVMPPKSRFVVVDTGSKDVSARPSLLACVARLNSEGHDATIIWGDSTNPKIIDEVGGHAPFDLVFIDANHTLPYVRSDWAHYGQMGKMVAFHDIAWRRDHDPANKAIQVPEFWNNLREGYPFIEIKKDPKGKDNGIGVLMREEGP